ncbi:double Clp-N motif-containing P-loop nucleoside triphosphate hydrolases superfamily protein [Tasmannia lanceolata]|uniref:double Clp-N motif-containing P-loop nucleoside triphosphate hydrolases superfamily protein n=1 Tax=Tasmannia lanceolata TaxID=3420 RepID=UPI004064A99E
MRAGGYTVQQALTVEAATIVKQAVSLARRRGHAQVTPLHVANTMLSSSTCLLRTACLQSHSHPLQCKALELCFNVALNRLPASTSSPMLGGGPHHPSLSNALVAAFKRAQAHQRRGSIENQQQPLLAVKVEIEQLIISILDDPSVSRVMREAGFSSTQVKNNVEQAVSLEICAPNPSKQKEVGNLLVLGSNNRSPSPSSSHLGLFGVNISKVKPLDQVRSEDVMSVVENLMNRRRRSSVIVGECLASTEGVVRGVMDKVDKGEVPEPLRNVQFISLPLFSFGHLSKEQVEQKLGEIRCLVKSCVGRGAVLYLGDLKWTAEFRGSFSDQGRTSYYCPVEHMIMELGRLVCGIGESGRLWLLGIATYQTYMKCRIGHPSLETVWGLHPLTIPAGSLGLSLSPDSYLQGQLRSKKSGDGSGWLLLQDGVEKQLTCCADCMTKFEKEAQGLRNNNHEATTITSSLPSWLQQYKEENKRLNTNDQEYLNVRDLCKKWNSICNSVHKEHHPTEKTLDFSCISSPSASISSYNQHCPNTHQTHKAWPVVLNAKHPWREHHFWISDDEGFEPNLGMTFPEHREPKRALLAKLNPNPYPNSVSSSDTMEMEYVHRFKELNAENLKTLCNALELKVSWQKHIIPEIASTILQCRSGMIRRKSELKSSETKEDTWLFFQGGDTEGKEKVAMELASLIFCSESNVVTVGLSCYSSTKSDSTEDFRNKRSRAESSCSYLERFADEVGNNPHRVFFMEDIEQVEYYSQLGIKSTIEKGRIRNSNGDEVLLSDAIIILSCESFDSRSRASSPIKQKLDTEEGKGVDCEMETSPCVSLDLNLSFEDNDDPSFDDVGLLEAVDRRFIFKSQEDL